CQQYDGLPYNF
nr:immunoglobulin light chain junction region [Macaca mulatta]MOV37002.1 immunoglobulin light chain junction region [Macaca mulatta]MOV37004.1 immunoglobulin light chain junction region [Macaca mulatta]MOV37146.1 immunoglobulin light chain junction region [Macaca mulatta]MOV37227.1 immunoglobulin light chain junction region [Macaca mulatta]